MSKDPFVVIGAGQAGLQIVDSLRRKGYEDDLILVGEEDFLPYQRPPLSKKFLIGEMDERRLLFRPDEYYAKQRIETRLGERVESIDRGNRSIATTSDERLNYRKLALATGARIRELPVPGASHPKVLYLRTVADARRIRENLVAGGRIVVVGGGFIGLEVAASARELGCEVTVIEAQDRLMPRVVAPVVSAYFERAHTRHGVAVLTAANVMAIEHTSDGPSKVASSAGEYPADVVIVGIGVIPNTELAAAAGLACEGGIVVDEFARTDDPDIVAAGDCTMHKNARFAAPHCLESVQNAVDQAKVATATMLGELNAYDLVPWFWSDQYEIKMQMVGSSIGHERLVMRGDPESDSFSVLYYKGENLIGIDSINRPADHMAGRRLMKDNVVVSMEAAADDTTPLKSLLA